MAWSKMARLVSPTEVVETLNRILKSFVVIVSMVPTPIASIQCTGKTIQITVIRRYLYRAISSVIANLGKGVGSYLFSHYIK